MLMEPDVVGPNPAPPFFWEDSSIGRAQKNVKKIVLLSNVLHCIRVIYIDQEGRESDARRNATVLKEYWFRTQPQQSFLIFIKKYDIIYIESE